MPIAFSKRQATRLSLADDWLNLDDVGWKRYRSVLALRECGKARVAE
ncbi:MAG: hypothetical protein AAF418_07055 [Pseudomonadota bacterium]